jgi:NADH:ubiquinone oxidoreductase subunit F (NADH-binding)/NADH:ubiquinone oxidoreductase subunit E/NAD-dependent dihydropyrimidine dehydrogenase PreA subunit
MSRDEEHIFEEVGRIVAKHGRRIESLIPVLHGIQRAFHYLPEAALRRVCEITDITPARIEGVASFYSQFRFQPAGKHIIRVCTGTACHVKGSLIIYDAFRRELHLNEGELTDAKGLFTLEKVACLGCCTLAPVVRVGDVTYGHVRPEDTGHILKNYLQKAELPAGTIKKKNHAGGKARGEIRVGLGSCCIASGSAEVRKSLEEVLQEAGIKVDVKQVGCVGVCNQVPLLEIVKPGEPDAYYARIKPEEVRDVILRHFSPEGFIDKLKADVVHIFDRMLDDEAPKSFQYYGADQRDTPLCDFLDPQVNIATENRGLLGPCNFGEYCAAGGFEALKHCFTSMNPQMVVDEIEKSGLRGRGGAGFPTGKKWQLVKAREGPEKYIICNGDEGDPGAFMDRMLLESYPFRIIEGMLIAAYATGASEGLFYIRAEYPLAVQRVNEALEICRNKGILGNAVMGSSLSFDIHVFEGAGAFVCGEETALIASLEGRRGMPRLRPPYPAIKGFHGKPTLINNTETFSLISWIIRHGAREFSSIGTSGSKGTKVFALVGKIRRGGLIEVPMGISIREIVEVIGGGISGDKKFKAVQIGGPSGGCIPASLAGMQIDFEALSSAGAMMGSGGLIVLDESDCMVDLAHYFLSFTQNQSCGKCTFCRLGTRRLLVLLEKIRSGHGTTEDLSLLEQLSHSVQAGSLCGLGKTAPNPVLTTLKYFREEYIAHLNGRCPAGKCTPLIQYGITEDCIGCTKCSQRCPSGAIAYKPYEVHIVENEKCIKCDICRQICPVGAVIIQSGGSHPLTSPAYGLGRGGDKILPEADEE